MRVIAGIYRHRLLKWPDDVKHIRPTKDRIREAIFGALGDINGFTCLDLYSGSGAMGIEAISRGASKAIFVDISPVALSVTKENLKSLGIPSQVASVYALEDKQAIKKLSEEGYQFDLIILDPPYQEGKYEEIIYLLKDNKLLMSLKPNKCIQCGLCSYVCPSRIELTDAVGKAKALVLKSK